MIQKLKLFVASVLVAAVPAMMVAAPVYAEDVNLQDGICRGANLALGENSCNDDGQAAEGVRTLIRNVINIISIIVGIVAVIMIIIGGLRYITSSGDSSSVSSAKNTILYAIVGLVVVALAQLIVRFVISKLGESTN